MDHNTGRQRAQKPFRMIKESNPSVKPFMWRVLREPKNFATQRLGYYFHFENIARKLNWITLFNKVEIVN